MTSTTNLTVDDSSLDIVYSSQWTTQPAGDPALSSFFQSTYHSAQASGASANISFVGNAIYVYGSKGPGHGNYSVQFDDLIIILSAWAAETMYQQPLFRYQFPDIDQHFVSIQSCLGQNGSWLDLDFVTVAVPHSQSNASTNSASTKIPTASEVISPPWLTDSTFSLTSPTSVSRPASLFKTSSKVTLALSIVFGSILLFLLLAVILLFFCRQRLNRQHSRERKFRYGDSKNGHPHSQQYLVSPTLPPSPLSGGSSDPDHVVPLSPDFLTPVFNAPNAWSAGKNGVASTHAHSRSYSSLASTVRVASPQVTLTLPRSSPTLNLPAPMETLTEKNEGAPIRPKRPSGNILDWFGEGIWDRNPKTNQRDDGNSNRTNFLQV